jgi:dihydroorotate dehydrogenase electron transfer subunit
MIRFEDARLTQNIRLKDDLFLLDFHAPQITEDSKPGQFVEIRVDDTLQPLLRRPMSILSCEGERLRILVQVVGVGTRKLTSAPEGTVFPIIGPLGSGFPRLDRAILIGGGTGIAPLTFFARSHPETVDVFIVGFRTRPVDAVLDLLEDIEVRTLMCTEDASLGTRGTVCDGLAAHDTPQDSHFLACGPTPMLAALADLLPVERTFVSLEGIMACGTGLCLGCAVKRRDGSGYLRTCTDGPVFHLSDVDINFDTKL